MTVACVDPPLTYSYKEPFLQDIGEFLFYVAPLVLCVVLWKLFVTNRRRNLTVLQLDTRASLDSSATDDR